MSSYSTCQPFIEYYCQADLSMLVLRVISVRVLVLTSQIETGPTFNMISEPLGIHSLQCWEPCFTPHIPRLPRSKWWTGAPGGCANHYTTASLLCVSVFQWSERSITPAADTYSQQWTNYHIHWVIYRRMIAQGSAIIEWPVVSSTALASRWCPVDSSEEIVFSKAPVGSRMLCLNVLVYVVNPT